MAEIRPDDPSVRALEEAIASEERAADAAYEEETRAHFAAIEAAGRRRAAARREAARKRRNLRALVGPRRRPEPKPSGWRREPPRGNGTANKRKLGEGVGIGDVRGLRGLVLRISLAAGEAGLTPEELVARVLAEAEGEVRERFERLDDKVKNASDALYFARENQRALGIAVEKNGSRWRILPEAGA